MRVEFSKIGGVSTRYFRQGSGDEGVILLHGVGISADSWFQNMEAFGEGRTVIAPDMLGFGMTEDGDWTEGAPHDFIVKHLLDLCEFFHFKSVIVVGSSFGANIACHFALRLGSKLRGLVLVGCGPALNDPDYLCKMYQASYENGLMAMSEPTLEVCRRRLSRLVHTPAPEHEALLLMQLTLYALPGSLDAFKRRMQGIMDAEAIHHFDTIPRLKDIPCPTLVIWGRQDARGVLEEAEKNTRLLTQGSFVIFEDCGHLPYLEDPARFNTLVSQFLHGEISSQQRESLPTVGE